MVSPVDILRQLLEACQYDSSEYCADNAEYGDASVVVAFVSLAIVLVQDNDLGVPYVLWYSSFLPALANDYLTVPTARSLALTVDDGCTSVTLW